MRHFKFLTVAQRLDRGPVVADGPPPGLKEAICWYIAHPKGKYDLLK